MTLGAVEPGLLAGTNAYRGAQDIFGESGTVAAYLSFEAGLAIAEVRAGMISTEVGEAIARVCRLEMLDLPALRRDTAQVGYPIVPLVRQLVGAAGEAGQWVHFGATTQDVMDTALVLQIQRAAPLVLQRLKRVCEVLRGLVEQHRHTVMAGRSKQQHALPITFGYKAAVWLDQLDRQRHALSVCAEQARVVQFGGGVGTLAALNGKGLMVRTFLAEELGLSVPDITWHVSRDRFANLVHALTMVNAGLGKIALDVVHLMSTEVAELREPFADGRGTSSTMPQKRNPVLSEAILEAARAASEGPSQMVWAMLQDHERAVGSCHIERRAIANAFMLAAGASELAHDLLKDIEVNSIKMKDTLELTNGLMMAESAMMLVAQKFGRYEGHKIVHHACEMAAAEGQSLKECLLESGDVGSVELEAVLEPKSYLGATDDMINSVLVRTKNFSLGQSGAPDAG
jgi:3-carboxy-cis,cis-muconate cycloisomerase